LIDRPGLDTGWGGCKWSKMASLPRIEYIRDCEVSAALDEQLRALLSACFAGTHNERFKWQRYYQEIPQHRWLMREPGRVIAHVAAHEKRIGTAAGEFDICGIAEVAVHPDFRGRGLVKQLLAPAHAAFARAGTPFSFLFGNPKVYGASGYVPVKNALRHFDFTCHEWLVRPLAPAMVKLLGTMAWPEGEIDLRGPVF